MFIVAFVSNSPILFTTVLTDHVLSTVRCRSCPNGNILKVHEIQYSKRLAVRRLNHGGRMVKVDRRKMVRVKEAVGAVH